MQKIYIFLSDSGSFVAKMIKYTTKKEYAHISISLDKDFNEIYSFGRKFTYFPIPAGLKTTDISVKDLKHFKNYRFRVYELEVSDETYNNVKNDIENNYKPMSDSLGYDYTGLLYYIRKNKIKHNKKRYVCSTFCAKVLQDNNVIDFQKDYSLVKPEDFLIIDKNKMIYEGSAKEFFRKKQKMSI